MENKKPLCAVRGLLHGGRAMCGSVINAKLCGYEGDCAHQRQQQAVVNERIENVWIGGSADAAPGGE